MDIKQELSDDLDETAFPNVNTEIIIKKEIHDELNKGEIFGSSIVASKTKRHSSLKLNIPNIRNKFKYPGRRTKSKGYLKIRQHSNRGLMICEFCGNLYTKLGEYVCHLSTNHCINEKKSKYRKSCRRRRVTAYAISRNHNEDVKNEIEIEEHTVKEEEDVRSNNNFELIRKSYGNVAIGYVQVTAEHEGRKSPYHVTLTYHEKDSAVQSVNCDDCAASAGGCEQAIASLSWLHRRSEEPDSTSVKCSRLKSKLSSADTSVKYSKTKDIAKKITSDEPTDGSFLRAVVEESKKRSLNTQLGNYFYDPSNAVQLSLHRLFHAFKSTGACISDFELFIKYCSDRMTSSACCEVSKLTTDRAGCPLWYELRYGRITASIAHQAARSEILNGCLVERILGAYNQVDSVARQRGRKFKALVFAELGRQTKIKFEKCGLLLDKDLPIFAASSDGLSDEYTLEIKCPANEKTFATYFTDGRPGNQYRAQLQMQMHFAKKNKAVFCIAYPDFEISKSIHVIYVDYDEKYCKVLFEKCSEFWQKSVYQKMCASV
ncbi:uncharacterized protein LOC130447685 isoform X1 [Diorhabda sublineata]|uniref:uncharacterized protein LOC130447685 isoform X1 n=1 Tax=Diorhabda sublineata TaxID=1163346 RepID=UPI0024E16FD5|nr:uncharacterized protein LOC130447685 isoform X1 [Diorhabda sublineata]